MFTHDQIWAALDRLADARGFSPSGLARQAGLDPTAFNRSKRISPNGKPRWPSTESLSKVLYVTDCTMSDLLSLMDLDHTGLATPVPLLNYADIKAGRISSGTETFTIGLPAGDDIFALRIEDNRLHPLFRSGAMLVAEKTEKLKPHDRILLFSRKDGLKGGILHSAQKRTVSVLLPDADFRETSFPESDVEWTARILWSSQ